MRVDEYRLLAVGSRMAPRLTRLKINRFRDVRPTELHFSAGFNVLLGWKGAGKTTLLDLIAALSADDLSPYAKEAFDIEYEVEHPEDTETGPLRVHVHWEARRVERLAPSFRVSIGELHWESSGPYGLVARLRGEKRIGELEVHFAPTEDHFLFQLLTMMEDRDLRWARASSKFGRVQFPRLDEGLLAFERLTVNVPTPLSFMFHASWAEALGPNEEAEWKGSHIPWIADVIGRMGLDDIAFSLSHDRDGGPVATRIRLHDPVQGWVDARELNDSQKRLFVIHCRLATLQQWGAPFIADEPFNDLHPAWIEDVVARLEGMQSFVTTPSLVLLDAMPWSSPAELPRMFVRCERRGRALCWSNLSAEEATELRGDGP